MAESDDDLKRAIEHDEARKATLIGAPVPSLTPATITRALELLVCVPSGKELLAVPAGVTADDLRAAGFPDVAAAMERRP